MYIPSEGFHTKMTSAEFEKYALSLLYEKFESDGISGYSFSHNVHAEASDGIYQIDGEIKFRLMGVDFLILVECKMYRNAVKREAVATLYDKMRAIGAQKGIIISTSSYQTGALKYAKEHGIALLTVVDGHLQYEQRSKNAALPQWVLDREPRYIVAKQTYISDTSYSVSYCRDNFELTSILCE